MRRYTTPTNKLVVKGKDLTGTDVYVTYSQGNGAGRIVRSIEAETVTFDGEDTEVTVSLSQLETARFSVGSCSVQVNWIVDGKRNATTIAQVPVEANLLEEEL